MNLATALLHLESEVLVLDIAIIAISNTPTQGSPALVLYPEVLLETAWGYLEVKGLLTSVIAIPQCILHHDAESVEQAVNACTAVEYEQKDDAHGMSSYVMKGKVGHL